MPAAGRRHFAGGLLVPPSVAQAEKRYVPLMGNMENKAVSVRQPIH
jgi:hypothetical protein